MNSKFGEAKRLINIALHHPDKIIKAFIVLLGEGPEVVKEKIKRQDIIEDYSAFINTQYLKWVRNNFPSKKELEAQRKKKFRLTPKISIITPTFNTDKKLLKECIESVLSQSYINWELCIADDASENKAIKEVIREYSLKDNRIKYTFRKNNGHISQASNSALEFATGDYIAILDHDDFLWPNALFEVVKLINESPGVDFIYSDEDKIEQNGKLHCEPFFKPDFSPNYLRSVNYITHFVVIRKGIVNRVGGFRVGFEGAQDWDLFLRVTNLIKGKKKSVLHIPKVLYSWRKSSTSAAKEGVGENIKKYAFKNQKKVLFNDLLDRGYKGEILPTQYLGIWRVKYKITGNPKVSIIIPTKDSFEYISKCLNSISEKTSYGNYQVVIVDTGSKDPRVWDLYKEVKDMYKDTKILSWKREFNYSSVCNFGAKFSEGDYFLFLNNDTEVLQSDWIENMLEFAQMEGAGAVGCKLVFPNSRIQHAGIVLGIAGGLVKKGIAGHPFKNFFNKNINGGYARIVDAIRDCSAVTGACLLVSREKFNNVGGFDPKFRIAFNDVDLCLKLMQKDWYNIYTPYAILYHHESVSVGLPGEKGRSKKEFFAEVFAMHQKWGELLKHDPFYNRNLSLKSEEYTISV